MLVPASPLARDAAQDILCGGAYVPVLAERCRAANLCGSVLDGELLWSRWCALHNNVTPPVMVSCQVWPGLQENAVTVEGIEIRPLHSSALSALSVRTPICAPACQHALVSCGFILAATDKQAQHALPCAPIPIGGRQCLACCKACNPVETLHHTL